MKKLSLKPPERMVALQAVWDQQGPADLGPCGEWESGGGSGSWLAVLTAVLPPCRWLLSSVLVCV